VNWRFSTAKIASFLCLEPGLLNTSLWLDRFCVG
jgi:hypothetical protein